MALSTVTAALTQYNANSDWYDSQAVAKLRLEAVEFLLSQRAQSMSDQGSQLDFESLESQRKTLITFLGIGTPRAFGRSRRVTAAFCGRNGIQ